MLLASLPVSVPIPFRKYLVAVFSGVPSLFWISTVDIRTRRVAWVVDVGVVALRRVSKEVPRVLTGRIRHLFVCMDIVDGPVLSVTFPQVDILIVYECVVHPVETTPDGDRRGEDEWEHVHWNEAFGDTEGGMHLGEMETGKGG